MRLCIVEPHSSLYAAPLFCHYPCKNYEIALRIEGEKNTRPIIYPNNVMHCRGGPRRLVVGLSCYRVGDVACRCQVSAKSKQIERAGWLIKRIML